MKGGTQSALENISEGGIKSIHAYNVPKTSNLFSLSLFTAYWMFAIQGKSEQKLVYSDYKRKRKNRLESDALKSLICSACLNKAFDIEACCLQRGKDILLDTKRLK